MAFRQTVSDVEFNRLVNKDGFCEQFGQNFKNKHEMHDFMVKNNKVVAVESGDYISSQRKKAEENYERAREEALRKCPQTVAPRQGTGKKIFFMGS